MLQAHSASQRREKQSDGYGKSGDSVHGAVVVVPRYTDEVEATLSQMCRDHAPRDDIDAVLSEEECLGFHKLSIVLAADDLHLQNGYTALAAFEQSLIVLREKFPWVRNLHLQADNGSTYHCSLFVLGAWHIADHHDFALLRYWNNTPGHGKDLVDHLFGALKGHVKRWVAAGADAPTGKHLIVLGSRGAFLTDRTPWLSTECTSLHCSPDSLKQCCLKCDRLLSCGCFCCAAPLDCINVLYLMCCVC